MKLGASDKEVVPAPMTKRPVDVPFCDTLKVGKSVAEESASEASLVGMGVNGPSVGTIVALFPVGTAVAEGMSLPELYVPLMSPETEDVVAELSEAAAADKDSARDDIEDADA